MKEKDVLLSHVRALKQRMKLKKQRAVRALARRAASA
jgi:hypothetical protein